MDFVSLEALQGQLKIVAAKPSVWSVLRAPTVCQQAGGMNQVDLAVELSLWEFAI